MKRAIRSALSAIVVICLLSTSLFTGSTLAISESTNTLRNQIITAVNSLIATNSTTASDIEDAVTSVDSTASIEWILPFRKNDAMNGVKIKVGTTEYGEVSPHNGSVTGLLAITASGDTFNVSVNSEIKASYDAAVICNSVKEVTITSSSDTFSSLGGNLTDANQLVIINSNIGAIPEKFMGTSDSPKVTDSVSVKAIIVKDKVVVGNQALCRLQNMLALTFEKGVTTINNYALRASNKLAYLDLGSTGATLTFGNAGTLSYLQALKNLYIGGYASVSIGDATFEGSTILNNIVIDCPVTSVASNAFNSAGSSQNICCVDFTSAGRFTTGTVTDLSSRTIIEYFEKISALCIGDNANEIMIQNKAESLDTKSAFTVSVAKEDNAFEVSITDANSVTVKAYVESFALSDIKDIVERVLDDYSYTVDTANDDIENYIKDRVIAEYDITWLDDYFSTEKVDGAEVWAREDAESEYTLYGTVSGQDSVAHGSFIIKSGDTTCCVVEINKTIEAAEYEKYKLTGIQITNGSDGGSTGNFKTTYDGNSELIIAGGNILMNHLSGTAIDSKLGEGHSQNIKAVIVRGVPSNWNCFANLSGLEVVIIENTSITQLGRQQFKNCSNLKYVYLPDNITTTKDSQSSNNQTAFYGCTSLNTVLVGANFDKSTFYINTVNSVLVKANAVTRYANEKLLIDFYNDVSDISGVASEEELQSIIEGLPSYNENYDVDIDFSESTGITVTINNLITVDIHNIYDVNGDLCIDIRDIVRLNKGLVAGNRDANYDINYDYTHDADDLTSMINKLLGVSDVMYTSLLRNSYYRLKHDNELNVAYFGGSVTYGQGSTNISKRWSSLVTNHLIKKFPNAEINSLSAAIGGTGSQFGAYRAVEDLKLGTFTPDLVFIDFAINDLYDNTNASNSKKYMETIIRTIYSYAPNADIILVLITSASNKGEDFRQLVAHRELANEYNIPCINVGRALCNEMSTYVDMSEITSSSPEWREYYTDTVHPTDAGYAKYASYIIRYLDRVFYANREVQDPVASYMPEIPLKDILVNPEMLNAVGESSVGDFTVTNDGYMRTEQEDATLKVTFTGTSLKLWCYVEEIGSELEYSVDGGITKTLSMGKNYQSNVIYELADGLEDVEHTVTLSFTSITSQVDIRYFLITGETKGKAFSITN